MAGRRTSRAAAALALALLHVSCEVEAKQTRPRAKNLLLISIDTLRADALGTYGYPRDTSPAIDAFARTAAVFEDCQASSSWTLPTMASIFTSTYTSAHGCWDNRTKLGEGWTTLAEVLRDAGWRTGAVTTHLYVSDRYGLQQGFEDFEDGILEEGRKNPHKLISSPWVNERALDWLRRRSDAEPWFLWTHYFDPHHKYRRHADLSERFGTSTPRERYDGEIAFTDRHVGELLDALERFGMADDTVVVLVSDHGEEFGEHGRIGHRKSLYTEVLRVPLIVRAPGLAPQRVRERVRTIDLFPTLLELLEPRPAPAAHTLAGESFLAALEGRALAPRTALAELRSGQVDADCVLEGRWKYVDAQGEGREYLFDVTADPLEREDLLAARPDVAERLRAELRRQRERAATFGAAGGAAVDLSGEEIQYLHALGYVDD